jgi:hypothetical protein
MPPDIWRVPTVLAVAACAALALFATAVFASITIRRGCSRPRTTVLIVGLTSLAFCGAVAIRTTASQIARTLEVNVKYVDPGLVGYFAPPIFAGFIFLVGNRLLGRRWIGCRALLYCAWVVAFTALNVVNYCSPGWCETIGFPLTWWAWSDSMLVLADDDILNVLRERVVPVIATLVNLFVFVAVARVLARARFVDK